jgi:uncharacterized membrane protein (DUF2068 family)
MRRPIGANSRARRAARSSELASKAEARPGRGRRPAARAGARPAPEPRGARAVERLTGPILERPFLTPERRKEAIRAVAFLEAAKGAAVLLAGFGVLSLVHHDAQHVAEVIVRHLHLDPARHIPQIFLHAAARLTDHRAVLLAAGAGAYCVVRFIEAYGLWRQRGWAEGFAALSGGVYMPFEIERLVRGEGWVAATALGINAAVVAFMLYALRLRRREEAARRQVAAGR